MNIIKKKINIIELLYITIVLIGFLYNYTYYNYFNIDITKYYIIQDYLYYSLDTIVALTVFLTLIILVVFMRQKLNGKQFEIDLPSWLRIFLLIMFLGICIAGTIILLFSIIFAFIYSDSIKIDTTRLILEGVFSLSGVIFFIISAYITDKLPTKKIAYTIIFIISMTIFVPQFAIQRAHMVQSKINADPITPKYYTNNGILDNNFKLIGNNKEYLFFVNKEGKSTILPSKEIQRIEKN